LALARLLRLSGREVQTAGNIAEAIKLTDTQHFDLLLCDLTLPDGDGCELIERLLAREGGEPIKAIAVTGHAYPADAARTKAAGFIHHVTKPVDLSELSKFIDDLC